jgi:hypothetical protein
MVGEMKRQKTDVVRLNAEADFFRRRLRRGITRGGAADK